MTRPPTFIGIGTVRGGSTWLHELLDGHPDVWLPSAKRKELIYFDRLHQRYDRDWYLAQFAGAPDDAVAIGEISPTYLASPGAASRIRATLPDLDRLVVILRDPAKRAWSEYQWRRRHDNVSVPIATWLAEHEQFDLGSRYATTLPAYLDVFGDHELLILVSEDAFVDPIAARIRVAEHLGIDPNRFPADAGTQPVNEGGMPRFQRLFSVASRVRRQLVFRDLDVIPAIAKRLGLRRLLIGSGEAPPRPTDDELVWLHDRYADDRAWVEAKLGRSLATWGPSPTSA